MDSSTPLPVLPIDLQEIVGCNGKGDAGTDWRDKNAELREE